MGSIPNLCWISRTGECFSCDAFRIEAEDSVKSALYRGLSLLPEGKNGVPLRLIQKAAVTEEEGYRLVLTPEGILLESGSVRGLHYGLSALKLLRFRGAGRPQH